MQYVLAFVDKAGKTIEVPGEGNGEMIQSDRMPFVPGVGDLVSIFEDDREYRVVSRRFTYGEPDDAWSVVVVLEETG